MKPDVNKHQRHLALCHLIEEWFFDAEGHHRDSLDLTFEQTANAVRHALRIVIGGTYQNLVTVCDRDVFKPLNQLREKRVGDLTSLHRSENTLACARSILDTTPNQANLKVTFGGLSI
jgi:hypothetical protein